ncbi:MAG: acetyl-CoA carboxylase biotin carboxyl carrier protein subunit [Bacteroidales bacterium]|nr:acetyl-CoA carboxylase biotin carboxyl carrier protein subunit [Bacteroidales bacterium]
MSYEVNLDKRNAIVELIYQDGDHIKVAVDNTVYELDIAMVEEGIYSVLLDNKSFNLELIRNGSSKKYTVNTYLNTYEVEIIDAEAKYLRSREKNMFGEEENNVFSPMPGKIVKIPVKMGDAVKKGETVIIVSAMKMESEFKAKKEGVVKEILVKEDDTVDGNQLLIRLE